MARIESATAIWQECTLVLGTTRFRQSGANSLDFSFRIDTPYLIQVADREYYNTLQNYVDLKDAGKPVELYVFPNEYHTKWQPAHHYNVYRRNAQWFKFWLLGEEADDPLDPQQYERWRKLREQRDAGIKKS